MSTDKSEVTPGLEVLVSGYETALTEFEAADETRARRKMKRDSPKGWIDDAERKALIKAKNEEDKGKRDRKRREDQGGRQPMTAAHRKKLSDAAKIRRLSRKPGSKFIEQRVRTLAIKNGVASVEVSEAGYSQYVYRDNQGNEKTRKVRSDKGKRRGPNKLTRGEPIRKQSLTQLLSENDEADRLEEIHERKTMKDLFRAEDRELYFKYTRQTDTGQEIKRCEMIRHIEFHRTCGGIPKTGVCPVCQTRLDPNSRGHWVMRSLERRVICRRCSKALNQIAPEAKPASYRNGPRNMNDRGVMIAAFIEKARRLSEAESKREYHRRER